MRFGWLLDVLLQQKGRILELVLILLCLALHFEACSKFGAFLRNLCPVVVFRPFSVS